MKNSTPILLAALCLLVVSGIQGQDLIRVVPVEARADESAFKRHLVKYALGSIDKAAVASLLQQKPNFDTLTLEADGETYRFSLDAKDVRSDDYKLRAIGPNGPEDLPRSPNKTYSGLTWDGNHPVCITADETFFTAMIMTSNGPLYIESAQLIDASAADNQFVIYHAANLKKDIEGGVCGAKASPSTAAPKDSASGDRSMMPCSIMDIAIANDNHMYIKYGSVARVELHNLAVLNLVNTNYDNEFVQEIWHRAVEIVVITGSNPWYNGTDYDLLLDSFTDWADAGFVSFHDVGSLWTNRDLDDGVVGLAWVDVMCTNMAYNLLQDFSPFMQFLRVLQSHELGHNYGYYHDAEPNYIMSPSVSESNTWSPASLADINSHITSDGFCIALCPPATPGRVGIGTTTPHTTAILDVTSTTKGVLFPRMTTLQRNAIYKPAEGLITYDTGSKSFWYYNNNRWVELIDGNIMNAGPNTYALGLSGNVGIGVNPPRNKLDIATHARQNFEVGHGGDFPLYVTGNGPGEKGIEVRNSWGDIGIGINASTIYGASWTDNASIGMAGKGTGVLTFSTNAVERLRINASGNVGIGTAAPNAGALLDITSNSKGVLIPRMTTSERNAIASQPLGLLVFDITTNSFWFRGTSAWIELADNLDQEVFRNGPDKIYMALTDSVGIGTNNPATKLEVKTPINNYGISHTNGTVNLSTWIGIGGEIGTRSNHSLYLYAGDGINQFQLTPAGNVGIGVATPNAPLQLSNTTANRKLVLSETTNNEHQFFGFGRNTNVLRYQTDATSSDHVFYAATSATTSNELVRIKGNGNVTVAGAVEVESFIAPTLQNGFSNYNAGFASPGYYKDKMGRVHLRGLLNTPASPNGQLMFTLPAGYRPTTGAVVMMTLSNNTIARVDIQANGNVLCNTGAGSSWISLDNISFKAE
jgi:hypothetical protein